MPIHRKFQPLPLTAIAPAGWLSLYLRAQAQGLTGHLQVAGFPFNTKGWAGPRLLPPEHAAPWWPYEQYAYWIDAMIRCGHLLGHKSLIAKAKKNIDYVLKHADADGYLGPEFLKPHKQQNRWPHAVFFRAMMAHYLATNDRRILTALKRHYLSDSCDHSLGRDVCNVEIMLWLYEKTQDKRLLTRALDAFEKYNRATAHAGNAQPGQLPGGIDTTIAGMLSAKPGQSHGVTYNEIAKLAAIIYIYTGKKKYLAATVNAYRKIDKFHMLIDGVCSSSEQLRGHTALDSHETCDIADYTYSLGYLLMATGQAQYADKIERACFNAAPGAVTSDFRALQYFSCPNQVIADSRSNHNLFERGGPRMSYRPNHDVSCCTGQVNRVMPNFAARMWLSDNNHTIVAALYGPSTITTKLGQPAQKVTIHQKTNYPFSEQIDFIIKTARPAKFTLALRIPSWCSKARLLINNKPSRAKLRPASFVKINRTFKNNDRVSLTLPMEIKLTRWPNAGLGIERGPLVYALPIEEIRQVDRFKSPANKKFPALNLYPASPWNYALALNAKNLKKDVQVIQRPVSNSKNPWSPKDAPIELHVPARKVRNWKLRRPKFIDSFLEDKDQKIKGPFVFTPPLPDPVSLPGRLGKTLHSIRLVPYGCTNLRISIFPRCK